MLSDEQRLVWERRIGTIGVAYTEKYVAEVLDELAKANPLRFECGQCECKWKFHTQEQLDMIQRHMTAHMEALRAEIARLSAPVSDEEMNEHAIHYVDLVQPYRREPALLKFAANNLIAARKAVQAAVGSLSAMDRAEMEKE